MGTEIFKFGPGKAEKIYLIIFSLINVIWTTPKEVLGVLPVISGIVLAGVLPN